MFDFFQLAAIFKQSDSVRLSRIPLDRSLQESLAQDWESQYDEFVGSIEEIAFDAGYKPEIYERFSLNGYQLPDGLIGESTGTMASLETLGRSRNNRGLASINGLVGFAQDDQGDELVMFQNFTGGRVIRPGRFLLLTDDTCEGIERPGLNLDGRLSAVYFSTEQKLLFSSFRTVNTFLPLTEIYRDASEQEIREVLEHPIFVPEDIEAIATNANQWFQKRFALLRDSNILGEYDADHFLERSKIYKVSLQIRDDQIVFPADSSEAKKLLQFLCEELYRGGITDTLYETNSKRVAG